jgi:hypothetical protein
MRAGLFREDAVERDDARAGVIEGSAYEWRFAVAMHDVGFDAVQRPGKSAPQDRSASEVIGFGPRVGNPRDVHAIHLLVMVGGQTNGSCENVNVERREACQRVRQRYDCLHQAIASSPLGFVKRVGAADDNFHVVESSALVFGQISTPSSLAHRGSAVAFAWRTPFPECHQP